ncbi:MAG: epoxyqueuosine reductase QueH, partial [Oscillospiraceae bacterium]|nr:epoxyqueuosine reductase QueH [Oscillospiraceae bacterium]
MEAEIASLGGKKPDLLLHSCCAPCTSSVLERLYPHFRVVLFY